MVWILEKQPPIPTREVDLMPVDSQLLLLLLCVSRSNSNVIATMQLNVWLTDEWPAASGSARSKLLFLLVQEELRLSALTAFGAAETPPRSIEWKFDAILDQLSVGTSCRPLSTPFTRTIKDDVNQRGFLYLHVKKNSVLLLTR